MEESSDVEHPNAVVVPESLVSELKEIEEQQADVQRQQADLQQQQDELNQKKSELQRKRAELNAKHQRVKNLISNQNSASAPVATVVGVAETTAHAQPTQPPSEPSDMGAEDDYVSIFNVRKRWARESWTKYVDGFGWKLHILWISGLLPFIAALVVVPVFFGIKLSYMDGAARWSTMRPKACQAIEVAAERCSCYKSDCEYRIRMLFALAEDDETPRLAQLGVEQSSISMTTLGLSFWIAQTPGGRVTLSGNASVGGQNAWTFRSVNTGFDPRFQKLLPETLARSIRVNILDQGGRLLHANNDGSILSLLEEGQAAVQNAEWLVSLDQLTGRCCKIHSAGVTTDRRFLGSAQGETAVELWSSQDAHTWDLQLSSKWRGFLEAAAPLGRFYKAISAPYGTGEECRSNPPSMQYVETELGFKERTAFSPGQCYWYRLPDTDGKAVPVWPEAYQGVQVHKDYIHRMDGHMSGILWSFMGSLMLEFAVPLGGFIFRPKSPCVVWSLTLLVYASFVATAVLLALVVRFDEEIIDNDMEEVSVSTLSSSSLWIDTWDVSAPDGHVGRSRVASLALAHQPSHWFGLALLAAAALHWQRL